MEGLWKDCGSVSLDWKGSAAPTSGGECPRDWLRPWAPGQQAWPLFLPESWRAPKDSEVRSTLDQTPWVPCP